MKVSFRESGGFTGLLRGCDLDTDEMPPSKARRLQKLLQESGITEASVQEGTEGCMGTFDLRVDDGTRRSRVVFDVSSMRPEWEALVEFLQHYLRPVSPED